MEWLDDNVDATKELCLVAIRPFADFSGTDAQCPDAGFRALQPLQNLRPIGGEVFMDYDIDVRVLGRHGYRPAA